MTSNSQLVYRQTILVVTEFVSPSSNSTGEYFFHIVTALLEANCKLILVAPENQSNKSACEFLRSNWGSSFEFYYSKDFSLYNQSRLKAVGWLLSTLSIWYQVKRVSKKTDLIFFGTNPTFLSILNAFYFLFWRHKSILLCYDIFPDNFIALADKKYKKIIAGILKPIFRFALKKVKKVLVIGDCMSDYLVARGVPKENIITVSNWADGSEIYPLEKNEINKDVRFQFFGNLGPLQGIEYIIEAFGLVKSKNAFLTIAGRGKFSELIERFIENNNTMVGVNYIGSVDHTERNDVLNDCDIAIVSLDKRITGMGVPSKTYYSLAAGKPLLVIADAMCETSRLVKKFNLGWVVSTGSSEDVAHLVDEICLNPSAIPSSQYIRKVFEENFDRNVCTAQILSVLFEEVNK